MIDQSGVDACLYSGYVSQFLRALHACAALTTLTPANHHTGARIDITQNPTEKPKLRNKTTKQSVETLVNRCADWLYRDAGI